MNINSVSTCRPDRRAALAFFGSALVFALSTSSCSSRREPAAAEKRYQLSGVVLDLDPKLQTANIQHGPIAGWMEAMTMDYPIRSKTEFAALRAGDHITATVNVRGTDYDLTEIKKQKTDK